jgi:hypothetical protein
MRLLMRSTCGTHSAFPIPCFSASGRRVAGSYRLPALKQGITKLLSFLVSIEILVLFPRQEQNIFGWFDGFTIRWGIQGQEGSTGDRRVYTCNRREAQEQILVKRRNA